MKRQPFSRIQKCPYLDLAVAAAQGDVILDRPAPGMQVDRHPIAVRLPFLHVAIGVMAGQADEAFAGDQFFEHFPPGDS